MSIATRVVPFAQATIVPVRHPRESRRVDG